MALSSALAGVLLVLAGVLIYLHGSPSPPARLAARAPYRSHNEGGVTISPSPSPRANAPRLLIPKINVDAHIESVGVDSRGNMGVPSSPWDVAWYDKGPQPGDPGDAVLDGHLDWYTTGPAVFWNLSKLTNGDRIVVFRADGRTVTFRVDSVAVYPYNAHPIGLFATSGPSEISLITCTGPWDASHQNYLERLVVNAHPVSV